MIWLQLIDDCVQNPEPPAGEPLLQGPDQDPDPLHHQHICGTWKFTQACNFIKYFYDVLSFQSISYLSLRFPDKKMYRDLNK